MAERRRGRVHDAEGAREAILNAAEVVFAEHGFDGARIDAIAEVAGYNKSLLFHYYGDKLGLYTAVLQRVDQQANELQARLLAPLLADERLTSDASKFRTFLRTVIRLVFDFLIEHPHVLRMLAWEGAEGWQTFGKIASQFSSDDVQLFRRLLRKAQEAGVIRPGREPYMMFSIAYATCLSYLTFSPILEMAFFEEEDLSSPAALERAREVIVDFVVHGMMVDPTETKL
jgi:TetR/AcrR family transcriptional regulator